MITRLVVGNQVERLIRSVGDERPVRYLCVEESPDTRRIAAALQAHLDAVEVSHASWRPLRTTFRRLYIDFVAGLNRRYQSRSWWARPFTTKHALATPLCRDLFAYWLTARLVQEGDTGVVIVVTERPAVVAQLVAWARPRGLDVGVALPRPRTMTAWLRRSAAFVLAVTVLRFLRLWRASRAHLPASSLRPHVVVMSLLHPRYSWSAQGTYQDAYFGPLIEYVRRAAYPALILGILDGDWRRDAARLRTLDSAVPVVPAPACVTLGQILRCAWQTLRAHGQPPSLQEPVPFDGLEAGPLVREALRDSERAGQYFLNLTIYAAVRRLAGRLQVERCFYPYENRAFEKLALLAFREVSPRTRLVGYQHAGITQNHPNLCFGEGEAAITPLPDVLLTMGEATRAWLEREGNYPPGLLRVGCALRQQTLPRRSVQPRPWPRLVTNLLVVLATSGGEYAQVLRLLEQAAPRSSYRMRVRPHPGIPFDEAFRINPHLRRDYFTPSSDLLEDDLAWADVVLYASSTVGIEAMAWGLPVVYLDVGQLLDTNPLSNGEQITWKAATPQELLDALDGIAALDGTAVAEWQRQAAACTQRYFGPVSDERLQAFAEV